MSNEQGLNPEELLKVIQLEEKEKKQGRLKIFLGMAAGVGKTYAMLEEAQRLKKEGVDVVVGLVDTHGRKDTEKMLEDLSMIPRKEVIYKERLFYELDIDAILERKPQIILVDELAHYNVPSSRHFKRWQDVAEILDNGINVFTTLNVQHIESLKDLVEGITDIPIRETVPDVIVEQSSDIELIDITPDELLKRLQEGKVYLGNQGKLALEHFFKKDSLTALRELAMRFSAQKIDHDLHEIIITSTKKGGGWRPREHLLVAISHREYSKKLIRIVRRMAFDLDGLWIVLHVDDGTILNESEKTTLEKNLALARELGAEVMTVYDLNIAQAIIRVAKQRDVTQVIIGRSGNQDWRHFFPSYTLFNRLANALNNIDIHVIKQIHEPYPPFHFWSSIFSSPFSSYVLAALFVCFFSAINVLLMPWISYKQMGFLFILVILFMSQYSSKGPVIFASLMYGLIWDYFFIPPPDSFLVHSNEDLSLLLLYTSTATIIAIFVDKLKRNSEMLLKQEKTTQALYEIVRDIANFPTSKDLLKSVKKRLESLLNGKCDIILKKMDNGLAFNGIKNFQEDKKEQAAALWVFENNKEAGWTTSTLPMSKNFYIPLKGFEEVMGVLAFHSNDRKELIGEEKNFLYTVAHQLANHIERRYEEDRKRKLEQSEQVEKVYQTILDLLSVQLEKPLTTIQNAIGELKTEEGFKDLRQISRIEKTSEGLNRTMDNIHVMAKLGTGLIPIQKNKNDIEKLVRSCCEKVKKNVKNQELILNIQSTLPLVECDFSLLEILINNLLLNAIEYSHENSTIEVEVKDLQKGIHISVADDGAGIPPEELQAVFDKFYRLPNSQNEGLGLGLSLAKAIAEIHGGSLKAETRLSGGIIFIFYLPVA